MVLQNYFLPSTLFFHSLLAPYCAFNATTAALIEAANQYTFIKSQNPRVSILGDSEEKSDTEKQRKRREKRERTDEDTENY